MQLLVSREYPVIDYQTMVEFVGHERLFRRANGSFLLHLSSAGKSETEERVVWLDAREAITWLNEAPEQYGSSWEFAEAVSSQDNNLPTIEAHAGAERSRSFSQSRNRCLLWEAARLISAFGVAIGG
jgi:hypothetical protein